MSKEIETRINRLIGKLNTVDELARVVATAGDRKQLIHKRKSNAEHAALWANVRTWRPGDIVVADDTWRILSFDSDERGIQKAVAAGDEFVVWHMQPRARVLWLISVNAWGEGITYGHELAAHVDRLASAEQRGQLGDPVLRAAWDNARKRSVGYDIRGIRQCKFRKLSIHESFGSDNVDRQSEQA
jgi:L-amino acid N-acyltransferase YncA